MSETNESAARPVNTGKTLSLKKTETSTVKQSFSHGRTKAVVVEKKRARVAPGIKAPEPEKKAPAADWQTVFNLRTKYAGSPGAYEPKDGWVLQNENVLAGNGADAKLPQRQFGNGLNLGYRFPHRSHLRQKHIVTHTHEFCIVGLGRP